MAEETTADTERGSKRIKDDESIRFYLLPFRELLDEEGITEIAFNRPDTGTIFVEKYGRWEERPFDLRSTDALIARSEAKASVLRAMRKIGLADETPEGTAAVQDGSAAKKLFDHVNSLATAVASWNDDDFSDVKPILSATLPDGERVQFVRAPACLKGTISMTIRRPSFDVRSIDDYEEQGFFDKIAPVSTSRSGDDELEELYVSMLDENLRQTDRVWARRKFLTRAVELGRTVVIAGGTGSGKTTFMKALMQSIPVDQRIITIEDVPELLYGLPNHRNQVNLLYPSEATESSPVNAAKLMKSCLRMKPDRILLAELRSGETYDWLNSVLSGHSGSITSCHANNCTAVFDYLALKVLQSDTGRNLPYDHIRRLLYDVIDVVCHIQNNHGERHITEVYFKHHHDWEAEKAPNRDEERKGRGVLTG